MTVTVIASRHGRLNQRPRTANGHLRGKTACRPSSPSAAVPTRTRARSPAGTGLLAWAGRWDGG